MPATNVSLQAETVTATAAITANRFCTKAGAHAAAAGRALGVSRNSAAIGELCTVDTLGTAVVEVGGAIAVDAAVEADASARAVTKSAGVTLGRALTASSATGQFIEILLIPN